jgi:DNA-binding GntR family transcriptional regulator
MADIIRIERVALHDQVVARLRTLLIEGQIAPGAKLNERELCALLHVSRTPLREAIKLLASEGMVDLLPHRGAVAVKLSEADILNTFEVLAGLEAMAGELAAERMSAEALAEIRASHFEMLASFTRRDLSNYYRLNAQIHAAINRAAANPVLTSTYQSINARVQALRFRTNQDEAKWARAMQDHEVMIQALQARDGQAMREVMVRHLLNKRDTVIGLLRAGDVYPLSASS